MPDIIHDSYLQQLVAMWSTWDVRAALFDSATWTPSKADAVLLDITGAGAVEVTATGYARVALVSQVATLDGGGHRELLDSAVIDFGTIDSGDPFDTLVLFTFVTNDSDSWLLSSFDLGAQTTTDASPTRFIPNTDGIYRLAQP